MRQGANNHACNCKQSRMLSQMRDVLKEQARKVAPIGEFIRDQRELAQVSLRQLARSAGVSNPYLSQIERGLRRPSAEILNQIAKALRISSEQLYVQAGLLDAHKGASAVIDAVLADPMLSERHKSVLVEIYESFRREAESERADADLSAESAAGAEVGAEAGSEADAFQNEHDAAGSTIEPVAAEPDETAEHIIEGKVS